MVIFHHYYNDLNAGGSPDAAPLTGASTPPRSGAAFYLRDHDFLTASAACVFSVASVLRDPSNYNCSLPCVPQTCTFCVYIYMYICFHGRSFLIFDVEGLLVHDFLTVLTVPF